jgi:chromosome segregation ATPase
MDGDNGLFAEEGAFIEVKTDIEDFLKKLNNDPYAIEFRNGMNVMFSNFQNSFSNLSIIHRQFNEVQEKLRRNMRNKNEVIKNIEDDTERYNTLKNEFENLYLKIDNVKFDETEKDKEIKLLNEEIISLNQRKDQENLSNFRPQELELKMKLIGEQEEIENKIFVLEEKKRQQQILLNTLIEENMKSESLGKTYDEEFMSLRKKIEALNLSLETEKKNKKNLDEKFNNMKEENQNIKKELNDIQDKVKFSANEQERLQKLLDGYITTKNNTQLEINLLKNKRIP